MSQQQFQLKALIVGIDKLSPALEKIKRNLTGFKRQLNGFGKGGVQMGAGLAVGLGLASKAFADFEDAGIRLKGSMMGMNGAISPEFERINALATELGNKLPGTTADFQNMMTTLVRQGIDGKDILSGIGQAAAYLGVQLNLAPEQAAEFAAKMRTATGSSAEDMMGLMDIIQKTANLGVDSGDMLQGFSKLTPALDMVKVKGLEAGKALAPLLAMAIRTGMQGESAGNAYRKMFQSFFSPQKLGNANKLLAKQGISLDFTNGNGEFGGLGKMFTQLAKLRDLTTAQRVPILQKMFGDDAETLQVVQLMIASGMQGYTAMSDKLKAQADLQMRVGQQLGTLKNLFDAALGNATNLLAAVGSAFSPQIKQLVDMLGSFAAWAQNFVTKHPQMIRTIIGMATAFVAVKLAALGIATTLGVITALMSTSPLGIAIRALALGAGLIIANWEPITEFFKNLWEGITGFFHDGWEGIKMIISSPLAIARSLVGHHTSSTGTPLHQPSLPALAARSTQLNGAIAVQFNNAPQGMRVMSSSSNQSGLSLNPDVGYSSFAMGMP